ncbi:hypothetical protein [Faecalibacter rhinopitheci]|uniref:Uncharacterized protein n=1 Tax=Faecalibacter rhinopitheci TaxID=2779678 RepID=A0A8J7FP62_9FLAO|nr:hypothetical protein [Faecalibacter rhinopitheci]MBF0598102.1 hypothetical protein [Faecalibacter rhinopitheci]
MRKLSIIIGFISVSIFASEQPFTRDNPYDQLSNIEDKQIKGDNATEVYINQNEKDESIFDYFANISVKSLEDDDDPGDIPVEDVPIDSYQIGLLFIGLYFIIRKKYIS